MEGNAYADWIRDVAGKAMSDTGAIPKEMDWILSLSTYSPEIANARFVIYTDV